MKKKKNIFILGVTGQDGSLLAKYLLEKKYKVHGLVRKSATGNLKNIKDILDNKNFFLHHGDLLDLISIQNIIRKLKPNEIYNFADQDHVRWSFEIPTYSFDVTGSSVISILEIIKNHSPKSKYFQPLSSNVFGNSKRSKQDENEKFSPVYQHSFFMFCAFFYFAFLNFVAYLCISMHFYVFFVRCILFVFSQNHILSQKVCNFIKEIQCYF